MKSFWTITICAIFCINCGDKQQTTHPKIKTLTLSVYASAEVKPKDYYLVYPSTPGIIEEWFVEVGDTIKKGQLIAQIKNDNSLLQVESAELSNQLATEKYKGTANMLKSIQTEIEATERQLVLDSANYARQASLWSKKIGSQTDFEASQLRYDLTKNRLVNLQQRLNQSKIELRNAYLQSQKNLKVATTQLGDFGVKSIIDGRVFDIKNKKGELVGNQQPIAAIGKNEEYIIEMWVDEQDIAKIRLNQDFYVTLDAYPQQAFKGIVSKMYPEKNNKNQSFKIEGIFKEQPDKLFSGLSGEANIVLNSKPNTLVIPQSYLINDSTVLTPNGTVSIQVGDQSMSEIEVVEGLDTNTVIILPPVE